ncbi:hypothetical protein GF373_06245 [bacterium]|nr:hypothetical protein [bacterium]
MLMVTEGEALPAGILGIIGLLVSFFTILTSVPGVIAGFSLMQYKEWARIVIIIISIFYIVSGISFPIGLLGTGLGVYSLVVLFSTEATQVFKAFHSSS